MHLYIIDAIKFEYSAYFKIVKLIKIILVLTFNFFMYIYILLKVKLMKILLCIKLYCISPLLLQIKAIILL